MVQFKTTRREWFPTLPKKCPSCGGTDLVEAFCFHCGWQQIPPSTNTNFSKFLHVSDLHLQADDLTNEKVFRYWLKIAKDMNVDGIVISGDISEHPDDARVFARAHALLEADFAAKYVVVPGNHDIKNDLQATLFSKYFGAYPRITKIKNTRFVLFNSMYGLPISQRSIGEAAFALKYMYTEGKIGEIPNWLSNELQRDSGTTIAVLHHHVSFQEPDPVGLRAGPQLKKYGRVDEASIGIMQPLFDAEPFMRWARNHGISAVLHGHKHFLQTPYRMHGVLVLNAGSSTMNPGGTHYRYARLIEVCNLGLYVSELRLSIS